jgi:ABC-type uncharacterized transport system permease subunit
MKQLARRRAAQWNATKHEGAGMESYWLPVVLPVLADHLDGLKLFDGLLGYANPWED